MLVGLRRGGGGRRPEDGADRDAARADPGDHRALCRGADGRGHGAAGVLLRAPLRRGGGGAARASARAVPEGELDAAVEAEVAPYLACAPGAVAEAKRLVRALGPPDRRRGDRHDASRRWCGPGRATRRPRGSRPSSTSGRRAGWRAERSPSHPGRSHPGEACCGARAAGAPWRAREDQSMNRRFLMLAGAALPMAGFSSFGRAEAGRRPSR